MSLRYKKRLVVKYLQKDAVIRDGIVYKYKFLRLSVYAKGIRPGANDQFLEPGALPTAPRPRRLFNLLPGRVQKLIRNIILLVHDLFDAGLSLSSVGPDTFLIDSEAFHPVLSIRAFHQDVVELVRATREQQIDLNMKWIADLIEQNIIATSVMPEELKDGLIPLLRRKGASSMLYVIANHSSLVPIENRLELYSRMFVEIGSVLYQLDPVVHNQVLSTILFPDDWKTLVSQNHHMLKFLGGSTYRRVKSRLSRAWQFLRYMRNSSTHGMEHSVEEFTMQGVKRRRLMFTRIQIAQMLYCMAPLTIHSAMIAIHSVNMLEDLRVHTLFQ